MSENRLEKFLRKVSLDASGSQRRKAIVLSDSQGNHVKKQLSHINAPTLDVQWMCKGGARTRAQYEFLKEQIQAGRFHSDKLYTVLIWLGTCDLTRKTSRGEIELRFNNPQEALKYMQDQLNKFVELQDRHSNFEFVFLEIPVYSIADWNRHRVEAVHYKEHEREYREQEQILNIQLSKVNVFIRKLNTDSGVQSPQFALDLEKSRKRQGHRSRYSFNTNLLKDGIHPGSLLAKVWLAKILKIVISKCF